LTFIKAGTNMAGKLERRGEKAHIYAHRRNERDRNVIGKNCCHFPDNFGMMKLATILYSP
jgi:hypothetical protein